MIEPTFIIRLLSCQPRGVCGRFWHRHRHLRPSRESCQTVRAPDPRFLPAPSYPRVNQFSECSVRRLKPRLQKREVALRPLMPESAKADFVLLKIPLANSACSDGARMKRSKRPQGQRPATKVAARKARSRPSATKPLAGAGRHDLQYRILMVQGIRQRYLEKHKVHTQGVTRRTEIAALMPLG